MPQDITTVVWSFDAATAAGDDLHKNGFNQQQVKIGNIVWSEQVAIGDELIITDFNGKIIWKARAEEPNDEIRTGKIGWVRGFNITKLDSGIVMVHMDGK